MLEVSVYPTHCAIDRLLRCLSHGHLRFSSENSTVSLDIVSVKSRVKTPGVAAYKLV